MSSNRAPLAGYVGRAGALACLCLVLQAAADSPVPRERDVIIVARGGFSLETNKTLAGIRVRLVTTSPQDIPGPAFSQVAIKQNTGVARLGPDSAAPYFTARLALPIPPDNETNHNAALVGIDPLVLAHNHSPGFEILPNGDALAIYFSAETSSGASESAPSARFVQARLRYGAEEWDLPELFFDSADFNDQSGLLWTDGNTIRFFGGGRDNPVPFKIATSTDNGATWTVRLPLIDRPVTDCTPQPIVNAFRGPDRAMYFAMDAQGNQSFLWRSKDEGIHWQDMGGRTGGRHSTIVPLSDGTLLSVGGKNTGTNGYSFQNTSKDWGATWSPDRQSPFPALGGNQRPSMIRLANGHLCFVSDSYHRKKESSPEGWKYGEGCFVAISKDEGATWHFKRLPIELPHEADRKHGTLGYATVRQGPNGVIHVLATMTQPCFHYEFNEAWVFSDANDIAPETSGGKVNSYSENYPNGKARIRWNARTCAGGRYLLDGNETSYYEDGRMEHQVTYLDGRKTGEETFWDVDGTKLWTRVHHPEQNTSTWTQYWRNGRKRMESNWNTRPRARDVDREFIGLAADGAAYAWEANGKMSSGCKFSNGTFAGKVVLPEIKP